MPRRVMLLVVDFPAYRTGTVYSTRIQAVRQNRQSGCLCVELVHLASEQAGRHIEVPLSLPVRPQGPTSDFLRACGIDVQIGVEIDPQQLVGRTVGVRFNGSNEPCGWVQPKHPEKEAKE